MDEIVSDHFYEESGCADVLAGLVRGVFPCYFSWGGGGVVAAAAPLAVVETVTVRVSVLPDVGSELPTVSDAAAVVCVAPVDEVRDGALDVVGLSWFEWIRRILCRFCKMSVA